MWDIAPQFNALLVFAEHRYYGESLPFGNASYANGHNLRFLTSQQALADYAVLLRDLKQRYGCEDSPVIAFGGSYGGMLTGACAPPASQPRACSRRRRRNLRTTLHRSAWFRMTYPHVVAGAIAASAPILQFTGVTDPNVYSQITTRTFRNAGPGCAEGIARSWGVMDGIAGSAAGLQQLSATFRLCQPLQSEEEVRTLLFPWLSSAYQYLAMADYPYPSSFLGPMPAWPVKYSCQFFAPNMPDAALVDAVRQVANVFYNYSGDGGACFDLSNAEPSTLGALDGWDYQSCTEMVMPIGQYPATDMFYSQPWNYEGEVQRCTQMYGDGLVPRRDWVATYYGTSLSGASNIVFRSARRLLADTTAAPSDWPSRAATATWTPGAAAVC